MIPEISEKALILAPTGRDALVAAAMLKETGVRSKICGNLSELVSSLREGAGFALVTEEALHAADLRSLRQWILDQPEWSDFPFVLLTGRGGGLERNPSASRYLETLGNVTFLERPFHPTTLVSLAQSALRARRRQYDARARLHEIRASEERYRQIVEGAEDFAIVTMDKDGITTSWNSGAQAITLYSPEEAIGRFADLFFTPEDRSAGAPQQEMARAVADSRAIDERWHVRKDGTRFFGSGLMMHLPSGGFLKIFRDRTIEHEAESAARASEKALRAQAEEFQTLADNIPLLCWMARPDGHIFWYNRRWYEYTGTKPDDQEGWGWESVHDPEVLPSVVERWKKSIESRVPFEMTFPLRGADGQFRPFLTRVIPIFDDRDRIVRWFGTNVDISEQAEAAAQLEARVAERTAELVSAEEALRQSQKMEALGQLTGGVAHDFNNLLTPIVGSLDLLQRRDFGDEREKRLIDGALQSAERARTLVQRLLAFARRQPLKPTGVDLGELIAGMAELVNRASGPRVNVELDIQSGIPPVQTDPNQLEMAILNLAVNARDAMDGGGTLTISATVDEVEAGHRAGLVPATYVRLSVSDTGIGMDADVLERAIEPFFSTKGVGKGTGLGLSMVHGLAAQLGGAIALSSRPGEGTTVELWLPVAERAAVIDAAPAKEAAPAAAGTALLVDDEDLVRLSTADMLADLGYAVVDTSSGEEALKLIDEGLAPDLLVTDHLMPGMTGTDLARAMLARQPDLPVLVVSGYTEAEDLAPDIPRLTKPFRQQELAASLASIARGTDS